eukprot:TRINITY_DN14604_c0_g1_i3.p2 TRINITY_DN14604_c0_g1~~TRINITY_DN14604_c0_g1_i3.p2  ORF type:complete len:126 (+),score=37.26 TRINITY_DN14604_c0_g1_i3:136-513(+)
MKIRTLENEVKALCKKIKELSQIDTDALDEMLSMGKTHLSAIRNLSLEHLTTREKLDHLKRLVKRLVEENLQVKGKYNKLLDLHNQLIEMSRKEEVLSKEKLKEQNESLRWQLSTMHQQYEYILF